jgi:hypothetical protein
MRAALITGIFATVVSIAIAAETVPVHNIEITADVPTVTVSPRRAGRTIMRLPSLTYEISVAVNCETNWQPGSVSVSVADSRASISAEELQASKELSLQLRIPSNQIAPLRVEHFCVDGGSNEPGVVSPNSITIPGVVSAQASLRCVTESADSMMYVSKPLDVLLECTVPERAAD